MAKSNGKDTLNKDNKVRKASNPSPKKPAATSSSLSESEYTLTKESDNQIGTTLTKKDTTIQTTPSVGYRVMVPEFS